MHRRALPRGKSTLLACSIAGPHPAHGRRVPHRGKLVKQTPDNLAVVFQDYSRSLFP
ncbi:hypothetical protein [Nonomuraea dietziae]|uniref:hypothetical protein n=1 Tax=Nonomuraea dietziae TaxID=65515 RepID=UPI0031DB05A9